MSRVAACVRACVQPVALGTVRSEPTFPFRSLEEESSSALVFRCFLPPRALLSPRHSRECRDPKYTRSSRRSRSSTDGRVLDFYSPPPHRAAGILQMEKGATRSHISRDGLTGWASPRMRARVQDRRLTPLSSSPSPCFAVFPHPFFIPRSIYETTMQWRVREAREE